MRFFDNDPTMREALRMIKQFDTEGERRKFLDSYFGFDDDARKQDRCRKCRDTGWAMIYHPKCFVQLSHKEPIEWYCRLAVVCDCSAGDKKPAEDRRGNRNIVFGDRNWHIAVNEPDSRAKLQNFDLTKICDAKQYDEFEAFGKN